MSWAISSKLIRRVSCTSMSSILTLSASPTLSLLLEVAYEFLWGVTVLVFGNEFWIGASVKSFFLTSGFILAVFMFRFYTVKLRPLFFLESKEVSQMPGSL